MRNYGFFMQWSWLAKMGRYLYCFAEEFYTKMRISAEFLECVGDVTNCNDKIRNKEEIRIAPMLKIIWSCY